MSAATMIVAVMSVPAAMVMAVILAIVHVMTVAVISVAVVAPDEHGCRWLTVIARMTLVINDARRRDILIVVMDNVIDVVYVGGNVVAKPLAHNHPASIRLQTSGAISVLRAAADVNSTRIFPAMLVAIGLRIG